MLRILFIIAFCGLLLSGLLLLNVTAPNPTGRRYSGQTPVLTGQGSAGQIGLSGEMILAADLRLPRNEAPDQRQCLCSSASTPPVNECRVCIAQISALNGYRRPDFIGPGYIAESKNRLNLLYQGNEVDQIRDYATAARELKQPLWVYVRVNTLVAPEFLSLVHSTGGDVVYYFTVPGYTDPVDETARTGLILSGLLCLLIGVGHAFTTRPAPQPESKIDIAEDFMQQRRSKLHQQIDEIPDDYGY